MTPRRALAFQALVAALLGLLLVLATPGRVQRFWLDMQLRWAAPSTVGQGVMLIDLDEASLHRHDGRLPHARIGAVIDALRAAGARAVVLDLPLDAPQAGDPELARTLGQAGAPVVLALAAVPSVRMPAFQNPPPPDHWIWARLNLPAPSLAPSGAVWQLGVSSTPIDFDNRLRRWQLWHAAPEGRWPALPLAVLQALNQPLRLAPDEKGRVTPLWMLERNALPTQSFRALDEAVAAGQVTSPLLRAAQGQVAILFA